MSGRGDLRERIEIQSLDSVGDGAGGYVRSWSTRATVWAQVLPSRPGAEAAIADAVQGVQGYRIKVAFRRDVTMEDRIVWRGAILNVIGAADEAGRRKYTIIHTDSGVVTS